MDFPYSLIDPEWMYGAYLPVAAVWLWCLRTAPWRRLAGSGQQNVWLGTVVVLVLMWSLKAEFKPGLALHLLGATAFTLMFGRQLAIVGLSLVLAAVTFNGSHGIVVGGQAYGLNALTTIAVPVFVAGAILRAVERWLPANFFVFVFFAAFFGAGITVVLTGLASTLLLGAASRYSLEMLFSEFFLSYVLLAFAEAWLTGALITLMVVYLPHWVGSFDDRRYLWNK